VADEEEKVIRMATDYDRLLPGEERDAGQSDADDAAHWVSVYTELRQTKRALIANLREMMGRQSQAAQDELERADVRVLVLQVERFERRLSFWQGHLSQHNGHGPRPSSPQARRPGPDGDGHRHA
jgi:hypothetical protein